MGAGGLFLSGCAAGGAPSGGGSGTGELKRALRGSVVLRGEAQYEERRRALLWNARTAQRFPLAIARAADVGDVRRAVDFAGAHGLKVAVRGGGHSWCGSPLVDGAVVLDLGDLRSLSVDAAQRRAAVQPAVTGAELVAALTPQGLAFPVGHCPSVPLSGYLLAGGFGWNSGAFGPACMSVEAIELVDARGELLTASPLEHADLYWAARGAGAVFFGVVTRYHLALQPLPRAIRSRMLVYPLAELAAVGAWIPSLLAALPPTVELNALIASAPGAGGPRTLTLSATAFAGEAAEAEAWLAPLDGAPAGALSAEPARASSYEDLNAGMGGFFPERRRYAADVFWSAAPPAELLARLADELARAPSPASFGLLALPPAPPPGAPPPPDMAFSLFAPAFVGVYGVWSEARDDAPNQTWLRAAQAALAPRATGHYIGEVDLEASPDRARRSFTPEAWQRLEDLRKRYDPTGLFVSRATAAGQ